jgi:hypothetical protein
VIGPAHGFHVEGDRFVLGRLKCSARTDRNQLATVGGSFSRTNLATSSPSSRVNLQRTDTVSFAVWATRGRRCGSDMMRPILFARGAGQVLAGEVYARRQ